MTDPASLNVTLAVAGLSAAELRVLIDSLPDGTHWSGVAKRPVIGSMRFAITIPELSILAAMVLTEVLHAYLAEIQAEKSGHPAASTP